MDYVAAQMRALGAEVTLEKAKVPHWVRGVETAELVTWPGQTPGTTQKVVLTALGGSVATPPEGLTADVVVVDNWQQLRALPAGCGEGQDSALQPQVRQGTGGAGRGFEAYVGGVVYRGAGPIAAAAAGAAAVLVRSVGGADFRLPHTGLTQYPQALPKIPAAAVTAEDADLLKDLASQGPVKLHLTLTPQRFPMPQLQRDCGLERDGASGASGNCLGTSGFVGPGHGRDRRRRGSGCLHASDSPVEGTRNSSEADGAVCGLDERRRRLGRRGGLHGGSQGQIHEPHWRDRSDLGADHPAGIYYAGKSELGQWLRPVSQVLDGIGAETLVAAPETGEDINGLTQKGVPSFAPVQDSRFYFNYHHTAADTFDKVDPKHLDENAAVMAVLAYALADSGEPAPR